MYSYKTKGVCSREIQFDVENDIIPFYWRMHG